MATDPQNISRRQFVLGLGAGITVGGGGVAAYQTLKPAAPASPASVTIDPNTIRRRGVGFRGYDPRRASPGFTLFAPVTGPGMVYLIDIQGNVSHTWKMPYPPGVYGYLTDKGTLFYNGKIPNDTFIGKAPFKGGVTLEADWTGKVLWEVRHPNHHHDGRLLRNGNVILLCATELPDDVAKKVQGGRPGTEEKGKIWADYLVEMTRDGHLWSSPPGSRPISSPSPRCLVAHLEPSLQHHLGVRLR